MLESLLSQGFQADSPQNVLLHPGPLEELIVSLHSPHSLPSLILGERGKEKGRNERVEGDGKGNEGDVAGIPRSDLALSIICMILRY